MEVSENFNLTSLAWNVGKLKLLVICDPIGGFSNAVAGCMNAFAFRYLNRAYAFGAGAWCMRWG